MKKSTSFQCFACIRNGFNQNLACMATVFGKIEAMREFDVGPRVVGLKELRSKMQNPWVVCGDVGFEDADRCQVEEGAVKYPDGNY